MSTPIYRPTLVGQSVANGSTRVHSALSVGLQALYRMEESAWDGSTGEVRDISSVSGSRIENRVLNSEDMTAAGWTGAATVTATTAQDTSAAAIEEARTTTFGDPGIAPWTASVHIPVESSTPAHFPALAILTAGGTVKQSGIMVDTENGTVTARATAGNWFAPDAVSITQVSIGGTDYWRVSVTLTANADNTSIFLHFLPAANSVVSDAWSAATQGTTTGTRFQMENSSTLSSYTATTGSAITNFFNHGRAINGATTIAGGKLGRGGDFTAGDSENLEFPNSIFNQNQGTWGVWAKGVWSTQTNVRLFNTSHAGGSNSSFRTFNTGSASLIWTVGNGSGTTNIVVGALADNVFEFILFTWKYDGTNTTIKAYLDGVLMDTEVMSGQIVEPDNVITSMEWNGTYTTGVIDELATWNRDLDATEIEVLYNSGLGLATM